MEYPFAWCDGFLRPSELCLRPGLVQADPDCAGHPAPRDELAQLPARVVRRKVPVQRLGTGANLL